MASRPQEPPPQVAIPELRSPDHTQTYFRVLVSRDGPMWQNNSPIKRGTLYSSLQGADVRTVENYGDLYFVRETVPIGSNTVAGMTQSDWLIWEFASVPDAESSFNAEISQLGDAVGNPVFAREYTIRRDTYEAAPTIATGSPLTALVGVKMTNGGAGYKHAEAEYDCYGEDAEVEFVISEGEIISAIVTKEGRNFNLGSVINIIGDGSGATCVPIIQPATAVLTSQKKLEFADGDPMQHEFIRLLRVYEVLPGPWVAFTRYDDDLGPIQGRRRAILNSGQIGGIITPTSKTNYEGRDGSSVVLIEIQENWSDGTGPQGDPINPPYPLLKWATYTDERGNVYHTSQIVRADPLQAAPVTTFVRGLLAGSITKTWYEPYQDNPFLLRRLTESWIEVVIGDYKISSEFGGGIIAVTETTDEPGVQPLPAGLTVVEARLTTKSPHEQTLHSEFLASEGAWPILNGIHTDETTGIVVNFTKQVIDANTPYPGRTGCGGPFIEDQPYDKWKTIRIASKVDLNTLPPAETWVTTRPFNLPPTLLSVEAIWSDVVGKSAGGHEESVSVEVNSGASGGIIVTSRNGFRGYALTFVTRRYFFCHPPADQIFQPYVILPSSGSVVLTETSSGTSFSATDDETGQIVNTQFNSSSNYGGTVGDQFRRQVHSVDIRDHLVGIFNIINPTHLSPFANAFATSGGGRVASVSALGTLCVMDVRIPQSTPSALSSGQQILTEFEIEQHRFNIWETRQYVTVIP